MRAFCSWSGGKDAALALHRAREAGVVVEHLVTTMVEDGTRSRSHGLRADVLRAQAAAVEVPITLVPTSWADYEARFTAAVAELRAAGLTAGVFGDIDLDEHRAWVEGVCAPLGVTALEPLWQRPRAELLAELFAAGFRAHVVAVRADLADRLPPDLLGRPLDDDLVARLTAAGADPSGELGEYHTVVAAGPVLAAPLPLRFGRVVERGGYRVVDVEV